MPTFAADRPPETTRIRLTQAGGVCFAPIYIAEPLLRAEGFTDVRYVRSAGGLGTTTLLAKGEIDITVRYVASNVLDVDAGIPLVMLAGIHPGCFELIGGRRVQTVRDLKDKTVAIRRSSTQHVFWRDRGAGRIEAKVTSSGLRPRLRNSATASR
jgi:NitT/TauT family transport system substrate-binding protein